MTLLAGMHKHFGRFSIGALLQALGQEGPMFSKDLFDKIKRCLLLGRKAMTNLNSVLKSIDITLPTQVHILKAMIFPAVMYGCESWTIRTAKGRRINAFKL